MELTQKEFIIYAAIAGAIIGLILGLVLLLLGIKKNKRKLGIIGFISSLVAGPISGLLSMIVTGVFIWLILKKPTAENMSKTSENADVS